MKRATIEPIAIVGMACRFPGAASLAEFWQLLSEGRDGVGVVPGSRWNADAVYDADPKAQGKTNTRHGGFIADIDQFDAAFFGITPREAGQMDPQQRILLELAWEALEDGGIAPATLAGTDASVFVGAMTNDYFRHQVGGEFQRIDVHTGSGGGMCMLANRLSYHFDLRGPSATVDTACSSSLVAVFQACQSLWTGQSRLALAAGVNVMLDPAINVFYTKAGLSAPDARCKTFSAAADGIGRAEGAAVVVLKPLKDALADRDPIYAMIRGGAVNHDGRSNGLTQPNRWAQEQLLRQAFQHARVDPRELQYVELHGTGTLIGDPIEANALGTVLSDNGERDACLVGSVKTNFGHLEAAAGIAGLIKVALGIAEGAVPPSLWFDEPNPHIDFDALPLRVNTRLSPWEAIDSRRVAGVSSFGLGGSNAHLVLQSAPAPRAPARRSRATGLQCLLLSARSPAALRAKAKAVMRWLQDHPDAPMPAVCATSLRRTGIHEHRLALLGDDAASMIDALSAAGMDRVHPRVLQDRYRPSQHALVLAVPELAVVDWNVLSGVAALPKAREAWTACRNVFGRRKTALPAVDALDANVRVTINDRAFRAWHFSAQYALARQMLEGAQQLEGVFADGLGQLAVLCAAGAIELTEIPDLLDAESPSLELDASFAYPMRCEFSSGCDPRGIALDHRGDGASWQLRLGRSSLCGADVVVLGPLPAFAAEGEAQFHPQPSGDGWVRVFAQLAMRHALVWRAWAEDEGFVRLPSYPWQRESYWLAPMDASPAGATPARPAPDQGDSLLGARLDAPSPAWTRTLTPTKLAYLRDHQVQGALILPGAGYVELGLAVHAAVRGTLPASLAGLEFHSALVIDPASPPAMHVSLDEAAGTYCVHSRQSAGWEVHARGHLASEADAPVRIDLPALRDLHSRHVDAQAHYADMAERGFGYGPAFQGMRELWLSADGERALAHIERPGVLGPVGEDDRLHPALFDASLQSMLATLTARGDRELYIPTGIEQLSFYRPAPASFWCHGGLRQAGQGRIEGDIVLFDDTGEVIALARGVRAQALTRGNRSDVPRADDVFLEWDWQPQSAATGSVGGNWIVMGPPARVPALAEALFPAGADGVVRVELADSYSRSGTSAFSVARNSPADIEAVLQALDGDSFAGLVYVAEEAGGAQVGGASLVPVAQHESLLALIRGLAHRGRACRLVVATQGLLAVDAVDAGAAQAMGSCGHAPMVGLLRVATNEYPQLKLRLVDAAPDVTQPALAQEILSDSPEDEVALRAAGRFIPRLRGLPSSALAARAGAIVRKDGTYLITGGYGGFGLELANWLAREGATNLVLVGRSGAVTPAALQCLRDLRAQGVSVLEARADVADEAQMAELLRNLRRDLPPLRGVFHAAAVLDDAPLDQLRPDQIARAMEAKARGAWHLHRMTQSDELDHFVLFSSIASLLGGAGQGSYAMACAYLDALARYRRLRGQPGLSLNWGALANVGMATRFGDVGRYLGGTGVLMFDPAEAMHLMASALRWPRAELGVARMDWAQWARSYPAWAASPKYAGLVAGLPPQDASMTAVRADLLALAGPARTKHIVEALATLLAQVMEAEASDIDRGVPLPSLGLDSLMAMDVVVGIEDSFGLKVPMLMLMKGTSLNQLAEHVSSSLEDATDADTVAAAPSGLVLDQLPETLDLDEAERLIARLGELADNDVERLLQQIMHAEESR
ncbi:SDR family NAD(P)-dependent oxidoreductase [Agrilutibacter solisilvae]|uniref:SDR family NAD(P)-dependent oxidoreductase n=1 Tax=Agrilutibacter solisilvae TaxID=2763317 RepID=A0A974XXI8_9GAMM|nr:SDR family NAD(P)-dependent oxidoreductase [Lysobacter solisilvae]QSX77637.1 SDR family NAD(P)-dependent oxidoreductase [Lysobacter solisilvae]